MLATLAILIIALAGIIMSTSLRDSISSLFQGPKSANAAIIDGIPCQSTESVAYHVHAHLSILHDGQNVTVPASIGIPHVFGGSATCLYWLHTHDATGVIHVEAPSQRDFTLGQFFDIWGQPLTTSAVLQYTGHVTVFVDGKSYTGDPRAITLTNHKSITIEIGKVAPPPPNYDFSNL